MPGPPRWRQPFLVLQSLSTQKVLQQKIDQCISNLLTFIQQQARRNPDVVFGDGIERTRDAPENRAFCRKLAAEGMVLLKNNNSVLPLSSSKVKRVAIIGPNARERVISGGGSAALKPSYVVTPWDGITQNSPTGIEFTHHTGCYGLYFLNSSDAYIHPLVSQLTSICLRWKTILLHQAANPAGCARFIIMTKLVNLIFLLPNLSCRIQESS